MTSWTSSCPTRMAHRLDPARLSARRSRFVKGAYKLFVSRAIEIDNRSGADLDNSQRDENNGSNREGVDGNEHGRQEPECKCSPANSGRATLLNQMGNLGKVGVSGYYRTSQANPVRHIHLHMKIVPMLLARPGGNICPTAALLHRTPSSRPLPHSPGAGSATLSEADWLTGRTGPPDGTQRVGRREPPSTGFRVWRVGARFAPTGRLVGLRPTRAST